MSRPTAAFRITVCLCGLLLGPACSLAPRGIDRQRVEPAPAPPPPSATPPEVELPPAPAEPAAAAEAPTPPAPAPGRSALAEAHERAALDLAARGDLARALTQWKLVRLLEPQDPTHELRVEEMKRRIREGVREHGARGEAALQRGEAKTASEEFLRVLALDPLDSGAARRLREIEADYTKGRESAKVNKIQRGASAMESPRAPSVQPAPNSEAAYYRDTGIELFRQGEYEGSAEELEKYLRSYPDDKKARQYLADSQARLGQAALRAGDNAAAVRHLEEARKSGWTDSGKLGTLQQAKKKMADELYDKGVRASRIDLPKAIELWKQCLAYDPTHLGARSQLDKALRIQQKLKNIP